MPTESQRQRPKLASENQLIAKVQEVADGIQALEAEFRDELALIHPDYAASARNLVHYLALRRRDLRPLQDQLSRYGLSSLGRSEANVLPTVTAVLRTLHRMAGQDAAPPPPNQSPTGQRSSVITPWRCSVRSGRIGRCA